MRVSISSHTRTNILRDLYYLYAYSNKTKCQVCLTDLHILWNPVDSFELLNFCDGDLHQTMFRHFCHKLIHFLEWCCIRCEFMSFVAVLIDVDET